jgi:hypothetical protein
MFTVQLSVVIFGCAVGAASLRKKIARSATEYDNLQLNIEQ